MFGFFTIMIATSSAEYPCFVRTPRTSSIFSGFLVRTLGLFDSSFRRTAFGSSLFVSKGASIAFRLSIFVSNVSSFMEKTDADFGKNLRGEEINQTKQKLESKQILCISHHSP